MVNFTDNASLSVCTRAKMKPEQNTVKSLHTLLRQKNNGFLLFSSSLCVCVLYVLSYAGFFATSWTVACQAPLSMEFGDFVKYE